MKLGKELFKLTILVTCDKISEEPPSNVGSSTGPEPQDLASSASPAAVSTGVLAKSLSLSSYKMISLGKKNDVLSQPVKSGVSFRSGTCGY